MRSNFYNSRNTTHRIVFISVISIPRRPTVPERSIIKSTALLPPRQFEHGGAPCCGRSGGRQQRNRAARVRSSHRGGEETSVRDTFPHRPAAGLPAQRMVGNLSQKSRSADRCWCASLSEPVCVQAGTLTYPHDKNISWIDGLSVL